MSFRRAQFILFAITLFVAGLLYVLLGNILIVPVSDWFLQVTSTNLGLTL